MNPILVAIIAETVLLMLYVLAHYAVSRWIQPRHRWLAIKQLFVPTVSVAAGAGYFLNQNPGKDAIPSGWGVLACVLICALVHIGYLTVYAVFDRSISLRIIIEMRTAGQPLTFEQIAQIYDLDAAFERRLVILEESGFLVLENGEYTLTSKGQRTGRLIGGLKSAYRFGSGG